MSQEWDWSPCVVTRRHPDRVSSNRDGDYDNIYVMDADGGNVRQLTDDPGVGRVSCVVTPMAPGSRLASDRDGDNDIYVMDADGGNVRQLTDEPGVGLVTLCGHPTAPGSRFVATATATPPSTSWTQRAATSGS